MDDSDCGHCAVCGTAWAVNWSYSFCCWLCATCRYQRCERELKPTGLVAHLGPDRAPSWLGYIP
jgi:hypothetical protein